MNAACHRVKPLSYFAHSSITDLLWKIHQKCASAKRFVEENPELLIKIAWKRGKNRNEWLTISESNELYKSWIYEIDMEQDKWTGKENVYRTECMCRVTRVRTKERERAAANRGERRERERERERHSREMIYRKLPRSPELYYKHWAIACMWLTSCAAKEHANLKRMSDSREGFFLLLEKEARNYLSKMREVRKVCIRQLQSTRKTRKIFTNRSRVS